MGSMKGKQAKIDAAFGRLADMIQSGNLLAGTDPVGFLDTVAEELKYLRAENVKLKGTLIIKQDRINDLVRALRDTLRQLEKAINGLQKKQAKIDALMLEYCPNEMTKEQMLDWERHQKPVDA